jgi:hypothetical protein
MPEASHLSELHAASACGQPIQESDRLVVVDKTALVPPVALMPDTTDIIRQHAAECRAFAETASTPERRAFFLQMAAMWEELFGSAESQPDCQAKDGAGSQAVEK